ncbi:MAG: ChbG/HpnK family deacetylase [Vicinamibacterales bacterium]
MASVALIIHADDLGMARAINRATLDALARGAVTSASAMVPCPHFAEVAGWAAAHPAADIGIHLTFTCDDWARPGWGPLTLPELVPSLVSPAGVFWPDADTFRRNARPEDVEIEATAQVEAAMAAGLAPTHLDSHMFALARSAELAAVLGRVSRRFALPCLDILRRPSAAPDPLRPTFAKVIVANISDADGPGIAPYLRLLDQCRPGLNELIVHCGDDDDEMRGLMGGTRAFGAAARQGDTAALLDPAFTAAVAERRIDLISWRDLAAGGKQPPSQA